MLKRTKKKFILSFFICIDVRLYTVDKHDARKNMKKRRTARSITPTRGKKKSQPSQEEEKEIASSTTASLPRRSSRKKRRT